MKNTIKFTEIQWSKAGYLNHKDMYGHVIYKPSNQLELTMESLYKRLAFRLGNNHELHPWIPAPTKIWYRKQVLDFMNQPGNLFKNGKAKKLKARAFINKAEKSYASQY